MEVWDVEGTKGLSYLVWNWEIPSSKESHWKPMKPQTLSWCLRKVQYIRATTNDFLYEHNRLRNVKTGEVIPLEALLG